MLNFQKKGPVQRPKGQMSCKQELLILVLVTMACLSPFANKAIHIDDPLFVWTAQWIQDHPRDFYGSEVNWYGTRQSMAQVNNNPPLSSYYLALLGGLFGWKEAALHLGFLIPTLVAVWGIYTLARAMSDRALFCALAGLLTPVFLISSSTLMCDVMMLAFWTWTLISWRNGIEQCSVKWLFISGILAGLCVLTKFSGILLPPLLLILALSKKRALGSWLFFLLMPLFFLAAYEYYTTRVYGQGLFRAASAYSSVVRPLLSGEFFEKVTIGLNFMGGCLLTVFLLMPVLWKRKALLLWTGFLAMVFVIFLWRKRIGSYALVDSNGLRWLIILQAAVFCVSAIQLFTLAFLDWRRNGTAESMLLGTWISGVFLFATIFNWSANGRSILPMVPATVILLGRRLGTLNSKRINWGQALLLSVSGCLSLMLLWSDYDWANSTRDAAIRLGKKYKSQTNNVVFEGHWGFQYYMQQSGGIPMDSESAQIVTSDVILVPPRSSFTLPFAQDLVRVIETLQARPGRYLATMSRSLGCGFYSDMFGVLPFAFGQDESDAYYVLVPIHPFTIKPDNGSTDAREPRPFEKAGLEEIASQYRDAIKLNPHDPQLHYELAAILMDHQDFENAEPELLEAVRLNPVFARAEERLGLIADQRHQSAEAITRYRKALRLNPALVGALNNLAWLLATDPDSALRNGTEAVQLAKRACALANFKQARLIGTLAAAYAEAGKFSEAIANAHKAVELAKAGGQNDLAERNRQLLELYKEGKAYHETKQR